MARKQSPPDFTPPGLDLDRRPFSEAALDALIAAVGRPAASGDPAFRAEIVDALDAAAIWRTWALLQRLSPTARMNVAHLRRMRRHCAGLIASAPLAPDEGGLAPGGVALQSGVEAALRLASAAHETSPAGPRTRVPPPEDEIVPWRELPARRAEALTTEEAAEPFWGEGPSGHATLRAAGGEHDRTGRVAALLEEARWLRDEIDRTIERWAAQVGSKDPDPKIELEFMVGLVDVYERLFGATAGLSRDSATSAPSGPLVRFVRAVDGLLGIERNDEARARPIKDVLKKRRSPDRVK